VPESLQSAFEELLAGVAESAYGMALCLADGETTAIERLQQAVARACQGPPGAIAGDDIRLWFLGILAREHLAAARRGPERADAADVDDTPHLYLYARSAALGWPTVGEGSCTRMARAISEGGPSLRSG